MVKYALVASSPPKTIATMANSATAIVKTNFFIFFPLPNEF
jgi:hypothetical protein